MAKKKFLAWPTKKEIKEEEKKLRLFFRKIRMIYRKLSGGLVISGDTLKESCSLLNRDLDADKLYIIIPVSKYEYLRYFAQHTESNKKKSSAGVPI